MGDWQRYEPDYEKDRDEAVAWARGVLAQPDVIILDTETTGLHEDAEIVQIAVLDAATGNTLLDTLVRPSTPIPPDASLIHGIGDEHVMAAPIWSEVYPRVAELLKAATLVVIYNAEFDERMIWQTCQAYDLPMPELKPDARWSCAMRW